MKLQCLVVDDDPIARGMLENLCEQNEQLSLKATCANAEEALEFLSHESIDLLFLDVEMPGMSGIQLLEKLPYRPQVIITTVNKEYAFEAFEYQVTDFLHKPVHLLRFLKSVEKAMAFHQRFQNYRTHSNNLFIKEEGQYVRLELNAIHYFENVGDYVRISTSHGTHLVHSTLKAVEEKLNDPRFLKVHRSYIVNLDVVKDIKENTLVIGRQVIPVSRANRPVLMERINIL